MLSPYWYLNGPRPGDNSGWAPQGVPLPFQPRPFMAVPMHQVPAYQMMCPRPRMRNHIRPLPGTTVYPRQLLLESIKKEKPEEQSDLGNLEGVLNFNLANILPPDFGFGEIENRKRKQKMDGLSNQSEVTPAKQTASERDIQTVSPSALNKLLSSSEIKSEGVEDGFLKLVIDSPVPDHKRPAHSYSELIAMALKDGGELTVREIYQWIMDHFDYYQRTDPLKWQPSVRHTLTINPAFTKVKKVRGGNLWGHASQREQAFAREQKNHWKKQKIAEYVKTSSSGRRRKKEAHSSGSSTDTTPDLTAAGVAFYRHDSSLVMEDEEDMEGVEGQGPPDNTPLIVRLPGRSSKSSSNRSTPAKRAKKSTALVEEPLPEIVKTQTRHGRLTNKLDYKMFSRRGMIGSSPNEKTQKAKSKCPSSPNKDSFDDGPDYTSDEMDEDMDSDEDIFDTSEQNISSNDIIQIDNDCTQHKTPIDMITPEASPASSTHSKMFQAIANAALRDLDATCAKTYGHTNNQGTPAQLVVSDLQDFEPTESTESILASTSALTSFASMSEAAMILSSLESSPRTHVNGDGRVTTYQIEITVEESEYPEDAPAEDKPSYDCDIGDPCPDVVEEVIVTDHTSDLSGREIESSEQSNTLDKLSGEPEEASLLGDENVETGETSTPRTEEVVVSCVPPQSLAELNGGDTVEHGPSDKQCETTSPAAVLTTNTSPRSSPVSSPTSSPFKPLRSSSPSDSPECLTDRSSPQVPDIPVNECTPASPLTLIEPDVVPQPRQMHHLSSPLQFHSTPHSSPSSTCSTPTRLGAPLSLPPLRPISPNILHSIQPSSVASSKMKSPGFVSLPYAMGRPSPVRFTAAPWSMPGVHGDTGCGGSQHPLMHQDVHLSDAWTKKQSCRKCSSGTDRSKVGVLPPRKQHQPFGQLRQEIVTPIGIPMYMAQGGRMPSPVFQYGRGLRPVGPTPARSPYMQPAFFVPSPVRPDQTMQAVIPPELTPHRPVIHRVINTTSIAPPVSVQVTSCTETTPPQHTPQAHQEDKENQPTTTKLSRDSQSAFEQVISAN